MREVQHPPRWRSSLGSSFATHITHRALLFVSVAVVLLALTIAPAVATTVIAKNFAKLCAEADTIFVGTVSDVRSQWIDDAQTGIETLVTVADPTVLLGSESPEITLRFSGGLVDGIREEYVGAPRFAVGDRVVLFARDGYWVSPIVGFNQGCFRVEEGDEGPVIFNADRQPVTTLDGASAAAGGGAGERPLLLDAFIERVREELSTQGRGGS